MKTKFTALIVTIALIFTSVDIGNIIVKADNNDFSGITAECTVTGGGDQSIINAFANATATFDGVTYNNYARYKGVSASASSEQQQAAYAIDANKNSRWESTQGLDNEYLTVDFGNSYSISIITLFWEAASAKRYSLQASVDGNEFVDIEEFTDTSGVRTDKIVLSSPISVRAIRIFCSERNTPYGNSIFEIAAYGSEEQKEVVPVLSSLKVQNYCKYTGKYLLYFYEPENVNSYNVYVDDSTTPIKTIKGSGAYVKASELGDIAQGNHTFYVSSVAEDGQESAKVSAKFNYDGKVGTYTDVPQVYLYSPSSISSEYHDTADVTVSVIDRDNGNYKDIFDSACNIKIRGNTTAGAPKKPWNIKLSSKTSILGMDKGKKWCLLANSFDKSLMRNYLSYNFALENGVTYTSQNRFVEVYINGVYNGNYLLTEPVEAKKERVDIDAYNSESNDILLELGTRNEAGVDHFTTSVLGTTFDVNDPEKGDDLTDEQVDAKISRVKTYLDSFEQALKNQDYEQILQYIDEDTFVTFYIVNELFKNVDFNFSSTRFYIKDNKIYAGPMWDLDLSSGNCKSSYYTAYYVDGVSYKGFYCQSMNWYKKLIQNETFYNKVKERYGQLQYKIQNIYKNGSTESISIENLINTFGVSFERNYLSTDLLGAGWSLTNDDGYSYAAESGWKTWQEPIEFLRSWLDNRNQWLCEQWKIDMDTAYEQSKPVEPETEPPTTEAPTTTQEPTTEVPTQAPTTQEPTTEVPTQAPTTQEPTTEVPTQAPTTQEPTTNEEEPSTTVEASSKQESTSDATTIEEPSTTTGQQNITTVNTENNITTPNKTTTVANNVTAGAKKLSRAKIKSAKNVKKKSVIIKYRKVNNAKKYQIQYSTNKKFKKPKTKTAYKLSVVIKKLKKGKKYYFRVRAVNGKTTGAWSNIKKVIIKK